MAHYSIRVPWLSRMTAVWRALRRALSPAHRGARLFGLSQHAVFHQPGLVLIQIDGLAREVFERAFNDGDMPMVRRMIDGEGYTVSSLYSGLPSTTPAAQGELFYGFKTAVPAFSFADSADGKIDDMLSPERVEAVEAEIASNGEGLLAGGSGYCNIYVGGAAEPHFCAATLGWNGMFRNARPWSLVLGIGWHFWGIIRIVAKLLWESILIAVDLLAALFGRLDFKRECERIKSRLLVGIVLEELMTMAACIDVVRGLPIVHFNFLSYDEAGHLRGPDSRFARRTLRRIDAALARVVRAAHRSEARSYSVWIYSDHGQERTTPYDDIAGYTFETAVAEAFGLPLRRPRDGAAGGGFTRTRYLRARQVPQKIAARSDTKSGDGLLVAATGPVGHIYVPSDLGEAEIERACAALAGEHHTPMVVRKRDAETLDVWTIDRKFEWPRDAAELCGREHPFLTAIRNDLIRLCRHRDAGDVVTLGWRAGLEPISFVREWGAHGGAGPRELGAFALLPPDAPVAAEENAFLRHLDLRNGARRWLRRDQSPKRAVGASRKDTLRIASYNVHSCVGLDGRLSPARIARVLRHYDADVVALQELDVMKSRTGRLDQALEIARLLDMDQRLFHPAFSSADEQFGDALLSRLPLELIRASSLPGLAANPQLEPRGVVWATVDWQGRQVHVFNTHLGLSPAERDAQMNALLSEEWLGHPRCAEATVFCGDLNLTPSSKLYRRIAARMRDCQRELPNRRPRNTWFAPCPIVRIDHVFVRGALKVRRVEVPRTHLTAAASDHLPVIVDLGWEF